MKTNWITVFSKKNRKEPPSIDSEEMESVMRDFKAFIGLPAQQSRLIAAFCMLRNRRNGLTASELLDFLEDSGPIEELVENLEMLIVSGWFCYDADSPFRSSSQLLLSHDAEVALRTSKPDSFPHHNPAGRDALLLKISAKAISLREKHINAAYWQDACAEWLQQSDTPFLKSLADLQVDHFTRSFALYAACMYIEEENPIELQQLLKVFFHDQLSRARFKDQLLDEDHPIYKEQIIEKLSSMRGGVYLKPAPRWLAEFLHQKNEKQGWPTLPSTLERVRGSEIRERELFYNQEIKTQVDQLYKLMLPKNYKRYSDLAEKEIGNRGLIILLSGPPGTGKTELARQLAATSDRDLLLFDVSRQRQLYFGESEKAIRRVFESYRSIYETVSHLPILLFNECDSVFQRRMHNTGNTTQTENVVQTILLNEMENFNGIMVCTTNRPESMDPAFARRFHLHLRIEDPDASVRLRLLTEYFPKLDAQTRETLSKQYKFTAAHLEVFRKKRMIGSIVNRKKEAVLEALVYYLQSLSAPLTRYDIALQMSRRPIGFSIMEKNENRKSK